MRRAFVGCLIGWALLTGQVARVPADDTFARVDTSADAMARVTGIMDAKDLAHVADSLAIDRLAFWALALQEGGPSGSNRILGVGRWVEDTLGTDSIVRRRVCRDIGRMQVNPCTGPGPAFHPACAIRQLRGSRAANVRCAAAWYRYIRATRCPDHTDACALERYNGAGPAARLHLQRVQTHMGMLYLRLRAAGAESLLKSGVYSPHTSVTRDHH